MVQTQKRKTSSDFLSTTATEVTLMAFSTLTGILSARWLGPQGRGELAIVILWPSVISAVGSLGVRSALVYYQATGRHSKGQLNVLALTLTLLQSLILIFIGIWLIPYLTSSKGAEVLHMGLGYLIYIPLNLLSQNMLGLLQGRLKMRLFNMIRVSVYGIYFGGIVVLWLLNRVSVWNIALSLLTANLFMACIAMMAAIADGKLEWHLDIRLLRDVLAFGIRNHFGNISNMLNQQLDQMLMAIILSPAELGWYVVAVSVSGLVTLVSRSISILIFPKMASLKENYERRELVSTYSQFNLTGTFLLGVLMMALIPFAIPLVYTTSFIPSVFPAEILSVAAILLSIGKNWSAVFQGMGQPLISAKAEGVSLLVTLFTLLILLGPMGIVGASLASLMAYGSSALYLYLQLKRQWHFSFFDVLRVVPLKRIFDYLFPLAIKR